MSRFSKLVLVASLLLFVDLFFLYLWTTYGPLRMPGTIAFVFFIPAMAILHGIERLFPIAPETPILWHLFAIQFVLMAAIAALILRLRKG